MKPFFTITFALLAGVAIGALSVQGLSAQTKPPAYVVTELEITDLDAYQKEYVPLTQASIRAAGGRLLAAGQNIVAFDGAPPQTRVSINQFDSLEAAQSWRNSAQYKDARKVGDKYAKFRAYAVEGLPQ
jgi:uncharacterized protein (DUF1330 family)